jgi:hypothetical protein
VPKNGSKLSRLAANGQLASIAHKVANEHLLMTYGVVPQTTPNCSSDNKALIRAGQGGCRFSPHWCNLQRQAAAAPTALSGTVPCSLRHACPELDKLVLRAAGSHSLRRCLRGKRLAVLGDSTMGEVVTELFYTLSRHEPALTYEALRMGYKDSSVPHTHLEAGDVSIDFHPHQRNVSYADASLGFTLNFTFSGAASINDNHEGMRTLVNPAFEPEMRRLGVYPGVPRAQAPSALIIGTTFHDDYGLSLSHTCGVLPPKPNRSDTFAPTVHVPRCECGEERFETQVSRLERVAAQVAEKLTAIQREGTAVIWTSLFPRAKHTVLGHDPLRALADAIVHAALSGAGFFAAGGQFIDFWPMAISYFELHKLGVAAFGPSSLHYAPFMFKDQHVQPDFVAMRVQAVLAALCEPRGGAPLCGVGSVFRPQAEALRALKPECSCGWAAMSIGTSVLCTKRADGRAHRLVVPERRWSPRNLH